MATTNFIGYPLNTGTAGACPAVPSFRRSQQGFLAREVKPHEQSLGGGIKQRAKCRPRRAEVKNSNARRAGEILDDRSKGCTESDLGAERTWRQPKRQASAQILVTIVAGARWVRIGTPPGIDPAPPAPRVVDFVGRSIPPCRDRCALWVLSDFGRVSLVEWVVARIWSAAEMRGGRSGSSLRVNPGYSTRSDDLRSSVSTSSPRSREYGFAME